MDRIDRDRLDRVKFAEEEACVAGLLARHGLDAGQRAAIGVEAAALVGQVRADPDRAGLVEGFLREYGLASREGVVLMALAEALLRIPDMPTRDRLIAEKIGSGDWRRHIGHSDRLLVNASTWGLLLSGRLIEVEARARSDLPAYIGGLVARLGEPVIRTAIAGAMRMLGEQFVMGRGIGPALARADREGVLCSFDMLGEGARTAGDAALHAALYAEAIAATGGAAAGRGPEAGHGVSIKLSALHPRYEPLHDERVMHELYPRLRDLALGAARHDINLTIDAEEADRLQLSLGLFERLAHEPGLAGWRGLGLAVQAYQKRALPLIGHLAALARNSGRRLMVRLVKGAYWDSEIKRAQVAGLPDYPVFTTRAATDLSFLACARALIDGAPHLYPQFATHNAHSLSAVRAMASEAGVPFECQRLHGMGAPLYRAACAQWGDMPVRVYAPVGGHDQLLPYLVRRLLENGANSSFVHALNAGDVPVDAVVRDPVALVEAGPRRHPRLPPPPALYGTGRRNSEGRDISQRAERARAQSALDRLGAESSRAGPIIAGELRAGDGAAILVRAPADLALVLGTATGASEADLGDAVRLARAAQPGWDACGGPARAQMLRNMAAAIEGDADRLIAMLRREAGKNWADALAEVREASDFCHYYARLAEEQFGGGRTLGGPVGELNRWGLSARGLFACISPWNFPLAIFTGQIAAALAAGNAVVAKPAEQTPLIAAHAVGLFHRAGLDPALLALLPGRGEEIGAALVAHPGIDGVAFTGGTATAAAINRALAARPGPILPFIAETGGLNAMVIDTSALREQVIDDVLASAFGSAGQRCSALRQLFVPEEIAEATIAGLIGALAELRVGDPADLACDVGPVIDAQALAMLEAHGARLEREGRVLARARIASNPPGHYFAPLIAQVPVPDFLESEIFGPILHVYRYRAGDLARALGAFAARGFGLTLGIESRIDGFVEEVMALVPAGNVYVNRAMTGAVVGVQPFGGVGLSGTGPKAGGPHALHRFSQERSVSVNLMAKGGDPDLFDDRPPT